MTTLLAGVTARRVPTSRLTTNVLEVPGRTGEPVVLVHGNLSSAVFWQQTMLGLPAGLRPLAVDLRGFGDTDPEPVDATRGVRDYAEDLAATLVALDLPSAHLVGWSVGGGVTLQLLRDRPELVRSLTLVNPVSPYGFGGTRGPDGELVDPQGAGSGAGAANPEFIRRLQEGDRTAQSPLSPRQVLLTYYVRPPFEPEHTDLLVESILSTRVGDHHYPGDAVPTPVWPGCRPGRGGVLNAIAPTHFRLDDLHLVQPKPPILWVRGADDTIISDTSAFDLHYLGQLGAVPGWPGAETHPPQPMIGQTRAVLQGYAAAGGHYQEVVMDCGHSPQLERPDEFHSVLADFIGGQG